MVNLEDRVICNGYVMWGHNDVVNLITEGKLDKIRDNDVFADSPYIQEYNKLTDKKLPTTLSKIDFESRRNEWFLEDYYKTLNLETFFLSLNADGENGKKRILEELQEYTRHDMITFLRFCVKLGDFIKNHPDLLIGVGRGSSVSSYLLYLLKIHLVNPIKYNIPITEFLK